MKVLCVENYPSYRDKLRYLLHKSGYEVIEASSAEEAVSLFVEHQVDGVLLEYDLPSKNGLSVRGEMKQIKPHVPILLFFGIGPKTSMLLRFFDAYLRGQPASP
jgi:two-component system, OmpR family, KDP operon response regulator KdpE